DARSRSGSRATAASDLAGACVPARAALAASVRAGVVVEERSSAAAGPAELARGAAPNAGQAISAPNPNRTEARTRGRRKTREIGAGDQLRTNPRRERQQDSALRASIHAAISRAARAGSLASTVVAYARPCSECR